MAKRCAKCDYKLDDMCRFWQQWRKEVRIPNCSENAIKRAREEGALQYAPMGIPGGTKIKDFALLNKIWNEEFPVKHKNEDSK
ncbi:MAG: hypothetical protein PHS80_00145 [Methanothrix sp.]|nr:hypothetical protein [Methanothrix sp.]